MNRLHIIIDTREQRPWSFEPHLVHSTVGTLKTGDYAIAGDDGFAIERKGLDDFVGTISTGWDRFCREIERMKDWPAKVVIVEGTFEQCCFTERNDEIIPPVHGHHRITPQFIAKQISILSLMGVAVLFAGDAGLAAGLAYTIFKERADAIEGKS